MAAFTSKASGLWSSGGQTTWNEPGVPDNGDTVTINHAISISSHVVINGILFNANLTLNAGFTLTLRGNVNHGNAAFTMQAGSELIFDTTGATRKWLTGTASNQFNCKFIANGTVGSRCKIRKTGSNYGYFDNGGEGSAIGFGNNGGWEVQYTDWDGIANPTGSIGVGSDDFGQHDRLLLNCTFNACGPMFVARGASWSGATNKNWRVESCKFENSPASGVGYVNIFFHNVGVGTGTIRCLNNAFGQGPTNEHSAWLGVNSAGIVEDCYFDAIPLFANRPGSNPVSGTRMDRCTIRFHHNSMTMTPYNGFDSPLYYLCDHVDYADRINGVNGIGNPHCFVGYGQCIYDGTVIDYPHELRIDQGDGCYGQEDGTFAGSTVKNVLVIPSMTDGYVSSNVTPALASSVNSNRVKVLHTTSVGKATQSVFSERNNLRRRTGTAQSGTSGTITLDAGASSVNTAYFDRLIFITAGTGSGQRRTITAYNGATKVVTVDVPWATIPDATSVFSIDEVAIQEFKSNLCVGEAPSGTSYAAGGFDLYGDQPTFRSRDLMLPENIQYNFHHMAIPVDAAVPGSARGYRLVLSSPPDSTNIFDDVVGPQLVDTSRNAARWAVVVKGQAYAEPTRPPLPVNHADAAWITWLTWKRAALDAFRALSMATPSIGYTEMMPWVKDGFKPQNPVLENAGHDGLTIGALPFAGTTPPPPSGSGRFVTVFAGAVR